MALGQSDEALAQACALIDSDDPTNWLTGWLSRGAILERQGKLEDAEAAYAEACRHEQDGSSAHLAHSDALIRLGRPQEAIRALAFVADQNREPDAAVERLERIVADAPEDAEAQKWLGYAYKSAWRPTRAEEVLSRALELRPGDPDVHLWRGLTRILWSPHEDEQSWVETFDQERLLSALGDLAAAARLSEDPHEAHTAYVWLVDRMAVDDRLAEFLLLTGDDEDGLFKVIPATREAAKAWWEASVANSQTNWKETVRLLQAFQARLLEARLPVWATRVEAEIADNYLRLYELQLALDHLAEAEQLPVRSARPLTASLEPRAQQLDEQAWQSSGTPAAMVELDYQLVYGIGVSRLQKRISLLKAQAHTRLGDFDAALEAMGDPHELINAASASWPASRVAVAVVQILREAGELSKAFELIPKMRELAEDDGERLIALITAGSVFNAAGMLDDALACYREAEPLITDDDVRYRPLVELNLAANLHARGEFDDALAQVERLANSMDELPDRMRFLQRSLWAELLLTRERWEEAERAALEALEIAERTRGGLRLADARISWQAGEERLLEITSLAALGTGRVGLALERAEHARSRAFVEQLAVGRLALPEEAHALLPLVERVEKRRALLRELAESLRVLGPGYVDYEVIAQLAELDDAADVLDESGTALDAEAITKQLDDVEATLGRLRENIEQTRLRHGPAASAPVLTDDALREVLRA
jgi:tetratricopeptide (TPR) repeat protein